jgi:hypothetical protein
MQEQNFIEDGNSPKISAPMKIKYPYMNVIGCSLAGFIIAFGLLYFFITNKYLSFSLYNKSGIDEIYVGVLAIALLIFGIILGAFIGKRVKFISSSSFEDKLNSFIFWFFLNIIILAIIYFLQIIPSFVDGSFLTM